MCRYSQLCRSLSGAVGESADKGKYRLVKSFLTDHVINWTEIRLQPRCPTYSAFDLGTEREQFT